MALILFNPKITVNAVDMSAHIDSVTIDESFADVDTTTFGSTAKTRLAGLGDHKVTLEFQQEMSLASVEATIGPLVGLTTTISILPVSGATSSVNPSYTFVALVNQWKPLDAKVGEKAMASVTWPISGLVNKTVA